MARGCVAGAVFFPDTAQHGFFAQQLWHEYLPMFEEMHEYAVSGVALVATATMINNAVAILFIVVSAC